MEEDRPQNLEGIAQMDVETAAAPSGAPAAAAAAAAMPTGVVHGKKGDPTVDGKAAPWVEKYRPKTLDDVAAHKDIIDTSE
jgi:replication factor C subunit 3/5